MLLRGIEKSRPSQSLPLRDKVSKGLYEERTVFGVWYWVAQYAIDSWLSECLVNVFRDGDPLAFLDFSAIDRLASHILHLYALNEVECDHAVDDRFNFHKLLLADLVTPQLQMSFFINFPDGAVYWGFVFINFTFGKIKFFNNFVSGVVIDTK